MVLNDKRKATRREIRYTSWIVMDDSELQGCVLLDISDTGARLDVQDASTIPDCFILSLSNRGRARRKCHVVWRDGKQVGVEFDRKLPQAHQAVKKSGAAKQA
jgi:hypothetical protein